MDVSLSLTDEITAAYEGHGQRPSLLGAVDELVAGPGVSPARAEFERAGARDFLGLEAEAIPLYREALSAGLGGQERLQCLVQLGSSLRVVGETAEAVRVLREARDAAGGGSTDWVDAFLALALHSDGQPDEALAVALGALATHLSLYGRAVTSYAQDLARDEGPT